MVEIPEDPPESIRMPDSIAGNSSIPLWETTPGYGKIT
jgi:hypothetical protein